MEFSQKVSIYLFNILKLQKCYLRILIAQSELDMHLPSEWKYRHGGMDDNGYHFYQVFTDDVGVYSEVSDFLHNRKNLKSSSSSDYLRSQSQVAAEQFVQKYKKLFHDMLGEHWELKEARLAGDNLHACFVLLRR